MAAFDPGMSPEERMRADGLPPPKVSRQGRQNGPERQSGMRGGPAPNGSAPARPVIRMAAGEIKAAVDAAEEALIAAGLGFYQRGAFLVRPGMVRIAVSDERTVQAQRLVRVGQHALLEALTVAARWEKFDARSRGWVATDAPMKVVQTYMDRLGHWRLPVMAGIINAPTLRPDGSVLSAPGYDPGTGLLFDPLGAAFPPVPEGPTRDDALRALAVLKEPIMTFPFVGEADRAVALSMLLTATIRRSLPTAPMHACSAPVAGSGKSKLVDMASVIATGREAAVIGQGKTEEETEKRLGAQLLAGDAVIAIDNCEAPLGGDVLCQVLTQPMVRARILGRSEAPELPTNVFITATGNNLALAGDLTRRALLCRLDPQCERPELRRFDREPVALAKAERGRLLAAALTVLRAFHVADRPRQADEIGSFEGWSRWVRDALLWLGEADPVDTMELARASDPILADLTTVVEQWARVIGTGPTTVAELITQSGGDHELREALLAVAGDRGTVSSRRLGRWIARHKGRVVGGHRIVEVGEKNGATLWRLASD